MSIVILGGYGNFGKRIAGALAQDGIAITIVGRNRQKAERIATSLCRDKVSIAIFDAQTGLDNFLTQNKTTAIINTCGPFQISDYSIIETCLKHSVPYIDLADGRAFVNGITRFDAAAKEKQISIISGASTVPTLSAAVIEHYQSDFATIESLDYGVAPGQKSERGLATTQAILTYVGKPLKPYLGQPKQLYGWGDMRQHHYPEIGKRWLANCDIPDVDFFARHYNINHLRFGAGIELPLLHWGVWFLSLPARLPLPFNLSLVAAPLLSVSRWFDRFGSNDGAMHVSLCGKDEKNNPIERHWTIIAKNGDGPMIPCIPAIILAKRLATGETLIPGATPCIGMITLEDYMRELAPYDITKVVEKESD